MYTLHPLSPDNPDVEDCALVVKEGTYIPDGTIILISKNTYIEGNLFRFVQMSSGDECITFSISFDDDNGDGNEQWGGEVAWKWSFQTDFHKHMKTMKNGAGRFSADLLSMVSNVHMVNNESWDNWVKYMCEMEMIHEAVDYINEVIDHKESIDSIHLSHVVYADLLQSQAESSLEKAKSLLENSSRYEV